MAPTRHFNHAFAIGQRIVRWRFIVPEAQSPGLLLGDPQCFRHLFHGPSQLVRIVDVQVNPRPFFGHHSPFHQRLRLQPGLDREQSQTRCKVRFVTQLGRAHRGATRTGGHDAPTIAGKEHRVDQFRLATGKFRDKGHHDLVGPNLPLQTLETVLQRGVKKVVVLHPVAQQLQAQAELAAPRAVLVELLIE